MTESNVSVDTDADARRLLEHVPEDGSSIGNVSLMNALGWDATRYWAIRSTLILDGTLETGRGKGGSVHRLRSEQPSTEARKSQRVREEALYEPMLKVIRDDWFSQTAEPSDFIVWKTARRGREATGKWARPDITVLARTTFPYYYGTYVDVHTFEIKPPDLFDLTSVYEALAHRRRATHSWVLAYAPKADVESEAVQGIVSEAKRHGIGLIIASRVDDWKAWDTLEVAERRDPDPLAVSAFLSQEANLDRKRGDRIRELTRG